MVPDFDYNNTVYSDYDFYFYGSEVKPTSNLVYAACSILIFCISMPGNSFLLWALLREQAWKSTSAILLLQLTISDLCLTMTLPFWACNYLHGWIFGDWACGILTGASSLGLNSYVLILTAMTLYHYVAVRRTLRLSAQTSQKFGVLVASIVIWLVCVAGGIMVLMKSEAIDEYGDLMCFYSPQPFSFLLFDIYVEIGLFFVIPSIIMAFCCVHMWIAIKQCRTNRHHEASRLILGMIVVFFLCFVPYNIILFIQSLVIIGVLDETVGWGQAMHYADTIINTLPYFHCCLNTLVHMFGAQRLRRHLSVPCSSSSWRRDGSHNLSSTAIIAPHDASVWPTNI